MCIYSRLNRNCRNYTKLHSDSYSDVNTYTLLPREPLPEDTCTCRSFRPILTIRQRSSDFQCLSQVIERRLRLATTGYWIRSPFSWIPRRKPYPGEGRVMCVLSLAEWTQEVGFATAVTTPPSMNRCSGWVDISADRPDVHNDGRLIHPITQCQCVHGVGRLPRRTILVSRSSNGLTSQDPLNNQRSPDHRRQRL